MNVRIIEKNGNSMLFTIGEISFPLANTLRRIMLTDVPSMAMDDIMIIENSSSLHDEILALRLGLIPLKTDIDAYNLPEKCSCKSELGCPLCRTVLTLDTQAENKTRTIYSGNLVPEDSKIAPVSDKIPIVKLAPSQRVKLEAYAKLGKGQSHAKWQPISECTYRFKPIIEIDTANCDNCGNCAEACPKNVFEKDANEIKVKSLNNCILCKDCITVCNKDPKPIHLSWDEKSFIFKVESTGSLPVERIVTEAIKIYKEKYVEFMNDLEGIMSESKETNWNH